MPRKFNCSPFSFRAQDWRGASAGPCFGLIEMKPPKQAGCFGKVAANAAPWGGGQAWTGQFAYSLLQTVGSESAVNGMGMMFLYQIISWKKHFQLQTYLSLSSWVCFVSVSELKRQGRGECFWLGVFYLKTFFNNDLHVKEIPFWPTFRSPGRKYSVSSHSWEVEISLYSQIGSGCTSRGTRGFSLLPTRELKTLPQPCVHVCVRVRVRTHTHAHTQGQAKGRLSLSWGRAGTLLCTLYCFGRLYFNS